MSKPLLRSAVPADLEAVLEFWLIAAEGTDRTDSRAGLEALLARDADALVLAVSDDGDGAEIVGSLIAGWDGWRCHLYRLAVAPDRRRQGIGAALLVMAERRFADLGGRRVDAMVLDENELGRKAWLAAGYEPQPEWSRWVKLLPQHPAADVLR